MVSGCLPLDILGGIITLIPKSKIAPNLLPNEYFKLIRPITLLDCDGQLIMSVLAGRLSEALDSVIDFSQGAFLKNRSIQDIVIAMLDAQSYAEISNLPGAILGLDW